MKNEPIHALLQSAVDEDPDLTGLLVYDLLKAEVIATTFSEEYSKKAIEIQQIFYDTEQHAMRIHESAGGTNWVLKSLARKVIYDVRITDTVYIFGETRITEAPTAALEDALELALMVGRLLKE
ncbi:MAG TPA: hypothetical protein VJ837_04495 [Candidatus Paceibacterota bacterium]|nr:hypothetical protein [Candidatus Paceibacterota bacterium]